jgi:cell division septum initiation protein DivIVA
MNIFKLKTLLQNSVANGLISLGNASLPKSCLTVLIGRLPPQTLSLSHVTIEEKNADGTFCLSGVVYDVFLIAGFSEIQVPPHLAITIQFSPGVLPDEIETEVTVPEFSFSLSKRSPEIALSGFMLPDGRILVESNFANPHSFLISDLIDFVWPVDPDMTLINKILQYFHFDQNDITSVGFIGISFDPAQILRSDIEVNFDLPQFSPLGETAFVVDGSNLTLANSALPLEEELFYTYGGAIAGQISSDDHIGLGCGIETSLFSWPSIQIRLTPDDKGLLPDVASVLGLIGATQDRKEAITSAINRLGLDDITMQAAEFTVDLSKAMLNYASFRCMVTLAGSPVDLHVTVEPEIDISISYPCAYTIPSPSKDISLSGILDTFFEPIPGFSANADVESFVAFVGPLGGTYSFTSSLDGEFSIPCFGPNSNVNLSNLILSCTREDNSPNDPTLTAWMGGQLVIGDINFSVQASRLPDGEWDFSGNAASKSGFDMIAFLQNTLSMLDITAPLGTLTPSAKLTFAALNYNSVLKEFSVSGQAKAISFPILDLRKWRLKFSLQGTLHQEASGHHHITGKLSSDYKIGNAVFNVTFPLSADVVIFNASWQSEAGETISLDDLLDAFNNPVSLSLPDWMETTFLSVSVEIDPAKDMLLIAATTTSQKSVFIQISKVIGMTVSENSYQAVFGLAMPSGTGFSNLPGGYSTELAALDILDVDCMCFLFSTGQIKGFVPPTITGYINNAFAPISVHPFNISEGLTLAAKIDFGHSSNPVIANIGSMLPTSSLTGILELQPGNPSLLLEASLDGAPVSVGVPDGPYLDIEDARVNIRLTPENTEAPLAFQVVGDIQVPIGDATFYALIMLSIDETEADASFTLLSSIPGISGGTSVPACVAHPFGINGLTLDNIGGEIGVQFAPPGVDIGLLGKFQIGGEPYGADKFGIIVDLEDGVPNPTFLYIELETLDMQVLATAFLGPSIETPFFVNDVKISDLTLYWCEVASTLPDGAVTMPGFAFNGIISIFDFDAYASVQIIQNEGFKGQFEISPIKLPGLSICGDGTGITVKQIYVNDQWETLSYALQNQPYTKSREQTLVQPDGMVLKLSTLSAPYCHVSLIVSLMDIENQRLEASISQSGAFEFQLEYNFANIEQVTMHCSVTDASTFAGSAAFSFGIDNKFGPLDIRVVSEVQAEVQLAVSLDQFHMEVSGDFDFEGETVTIPTFSITSPPASFGALYQLIINQIEENYEDLFKSTIVFVKKIISEAEAEADLLISNATNMAETIQTDAKNQVEQILNTANAIASGQPDEIAKEIADLTQQTANVAAKTTAKVIEINTTAQNTVMELTLNADNVLKSGQDEAKQIADTARKQATSIANATATITNNATQLVENIVSQASKDAANILSAAQARASRIAQDAIAQVNQITQETNKILNEIQAHLQQLRDAAKRLAEEAKKAAKSALDRLSNASGC